MRTLSIDRMTFHEARMRKLLWALAVLGLLFLAVYATGFYFMYRDLSRFVEGHPSDTQSTHQVSSAMVRRKSSSRDSRCGASV
jgi:hypothetical protein